MSRAVKRYITETGGEMMTKQNFKKQCSMDDIISRARRLGSLDPLRPKQIPRYTDCTNVPDFHSAMQTVIQANEMLMALDPRVREKFKNDPEAMVRFCADHNNREEAVKMGLMNPLPKTEVKNDTVVGKPVDK